MLATLISTILLSDIGTSRIAAAGSTNPMAIMLNYTAGDFADGLWQSPPSANWRFAETKLGEPLARVEDTGHAYRALPATGRQSLENLSRGTMGSLW